MSIQESYEAVHLSSSDSKQQLSLTAVKYSTNWKQVPLQHQFFVHFVYSVSVILREWKMHTCPSGGERYGMIMVLGKPEQLNLFTCSNNRNQRKILNDCCTAEC